MHKEKASIKSFKSDLYQTLKTQRKCQKVIRKETAKKQNKPSQLFGVARHSGNSWLNNSQKNFNTLAEYQ